MTKGYFKISKLLMITMLLIVATLFLTSCKKNETVIEGVDITITFEVDGEVYTSKDLNTQGAIEFPANPIKDGYEFAGWFLEKDTYTKKLTNYSIRTSKESFTVYALMEHKVCVGKWINVKEADCIKDGLKEFTCIYCGKILETKIIMAHGHTILEGETSCSVCHEKEPSTVGLEYTLNTQGNAYLVSGVGASDKNEIIIAEKYDGKPVVGVADEAFANNTSLTAVYFPENILSIGNNAFSNCSGIESLELPNNLISIGNKAFYGCSKIQQVVLPAKITNIGSAAFAFCTNLAQFSFLNLDYEHLPEQMFLSCSRLVTMNLPDNLKTIGKDAFFNCAWLGNIILPPSVITIKESAFSGCNQLNSIILSEQLTTIESKAFLNCTSLISIIIPPKVGIIGIDAFKGCSDLIKITMPVPVAGCYGGEKIDEVILISEEEGSFSVKEKAFENALNLTKITFSENITEIGDYAFYNCGKLSNINYSISNNIIRIGNYAFGNCALLPSYEFNIALSDIGEGAFIGCTSITEFILPDTVSEINGFTFAECKKLSSITLNGVTIIKENAFNNCKALQNIILSSALTEIGKFAFSNSALMQIAIPSLIPSISEGLFFNCADLVSVTINGNIERIGMSAFSNCVSLSSIALPETLKQIADNAFYNCFSLTAFMIGKDVEYIGKGVWGNCTLLSNITLNPDNANFINENNIIYDKEKTALIRYASNKTENEFLIPDTVRNIFDYAFDKSENIDVLMVPDSIVYMGYINIDKEFKIYCEASSKPLSWSQNWHGINGVAIWNCNKDKNKFSYIIQSDIYSVSSYSGNDASVAIPLFNDNKEIKGIAKDTFKGKTSLNNIIINNKIQFIGEGAFDGCESLYSITADENNTYFCSVDGVLYTKNKNTLIKYPSKNLKTFYFIPDSVIAVKDFAFENCYNLSTLIIPASVENFGIFTEGRLKLHLYAELSLKPEGYSQSFNETVHRIIWDCYKDSGDFTYHDLGKTYGASYNGENENVIVPVSYNGKPVTVLYDFVNKNKIKNVEIPNTVVRCVNQSFKDMVSLENIYLPDSIEEFSDNMFFGCENLKNLIIPSKIKDLPEFFCAQSGLEIIALPSGLERIGERAFSHTKLINIKLPDTLKEIGKGAFEFIDSLDSMVIPFQITAIKEDTFYASAISNITLPQGITQIGNKAFMRCEMLTNIYLPSSLQKIGAYAFANTGLTNAALPEKLTILEVGAFKSSKLQSVLISKNLSEIGTGAFDMCPLAAISIKGTSNYYLAKENVLYNNSGSVLYLYAPSKIQNEFYVPANTEIIADSAFFGCGNLTKAVLPASLVSIGKNAFANCINLTWINIPEKIKIVREGSFNGCIKLSSVNMSNNITAIEADAFNNCSFAEINLSNKITFIGNKAFANNTKLISIRMPNTVITIGNEAFSNCTILASAELSKGLSYIGRNAFYACALKTIVIPQNVLQIGDKIFEECNMLTDIYCESPLQPEGWNINWNSGISANVIWGYVE